MPTAFTNVSESVTVKSTPAAEAVKYFSVLVRFGVTVPEAVTV